MSQAAMYAMEMVPEQACCTKMLGWIRSGLVTRDLIALIRKGANAPVPWPARLIKDCYKLLTSLLHFASTVAVYAYMPRSRLLLHLYDGEDNNVMTGTRVQSLFMRIHQPPCHQHHTTIVQRTRLS